MADEAMVETLRAMARERGVSFAEIVREALQNKAAEYRPKPTCLGAFDSGTPDVRLKYDTGRVPPRSWR